MFLYNVPFFVKTEFFGFPLEQDIRQGKGQDADLPNGFPVLAVSGQFLGRVKHEISPCRNVRWEMGGCCC